LTSLVYNLAIGIVDVLALWMVARRGPAIGEDRPVWKRLVPAVGLLAGMGAVTAIGLGENPFGIMRLACWGLFVHGSIWLLVASAIVWRRSRRWATACLLAGAAIAAVGIDAFFIEPTALEINHVAISSPKLRKPVKIVVIADFQTDAIGDYERRVLAEVKHQEPDMILWAGDYLQEHHPERWERLRDELTVELARINFRPPLGSFAVGGNVDDPRWPQIFEGFPVHVFEHNDQVEVGEIAVTGLAMRQSFRSDVRIPSSERFHIVLGHCPNFALGDIDADLLVAGHVHGGQVRLPGIGPLITNSLLSRRLAAGVTQLPGDRTLVVSRGIGMERSFAPRLRFLCRPELMVLHLSGRSGTADEGKKPVP
jgi:predicted MPP superfamily phosphohydrolase